MKSMNEIPRMLAAVCLILLIFILGISMGDTNTVGQCPLGKRNCSDCYTKLVESLLSRSGNLFNLSMTFFPPRENVPDFVLVNYYFGDINSNVPKLWFWSAYTSNFLHSPHTFQYLSLLFGKPQPYYTGTVNLTLDEECVNIGDDKMEFLTQRVSIEYL